VFIAALFEERVASARRELRAADEARTGSESAREEREAEETRLRLLARELDCAAEAVAAKAAAADAALAQAQQVLQTKYFCSVL
jgi:hypothetical protein